MKPKIKFHFQNKTITMEKISFLKIPKNVTRSVSHLTTSYRQQYLRCKQPVGYGYCNHQFLVYEGVNPNFDGKFNNKNEILRSENIGICR